MLLTVIFISYAVLPGIYGQEKSSESTIKKVRQHIFVGYDINARPVNHHDNTTTVSVGFSPIHITEVNENRGILAMECWMHMSWQDDHLKWDPAKFSGIDILRLPEKEIWKPDLTLYEARATHITPWHSVNVLLNATGNVMWIPPASVQVVCGPFDYSQYPDDTQKCRLTVGSWTNDANRLDLKLSSENVSLSDYMESRNPHWQLTGVTAVRNVKYYECCAEPYVSVVFELKLKRLNVPHSSLCSVPDTVARILILCMFWLPDGTRKLLLGCTSLLILTGVAAAITRGLPSPAAAPAALSDVTCAMALCVAAMVVEIIVMAVATLRLDAPACLDGLASSSFCRMVSPCNDDEYKDDIMENKRAVSKSSQWQFMATLIDRAAFVIFAILLLAM